MGGGAGRALKAMSAADAEPMLLVSSIDVIIKPNRAFIKVSQPIVGTLGTSQATRDMEPGCKIGGRRLF